MQRITLHARVWWGLLAGAFIATGCSPGDRSSVDRASVRSDSAGVAIITNEGPVAPGAWTIAGEPELVIGAEGDRSGQTFFQVRGVARVGSGTTAVLDGGSSELRYFDETGELVGVAGGSGDGPGEFRNATSIVDDRADSLVVFDQWAGRLSVFAPDGGFVRSQSLTEAWGVRLGWHVLGTSPDGRLVLAGPPGEPPPPGFGPDTTGFPVYLAQEGAEAPDSVAEVPWSISASDLQGRPRPVLPNPVLSSPVVADSGIWASVPMRSELMLVGWDGAVERVVRFTGERRMLEPDEVERIASWHRDRIAAVPEAARSQMSEVAILPTLPDFAALLVDDLGHLWVQEARDDRDPELWQLAAPSGGSRWRVFDEEGVWLTTVEVDPGFQPFSVDGDWVSGVWKGPLDEEEVRVYRLARAQLVSLSR